MPVASTGMSLRSYAEAFFCHRLCAEPTHGAQTERHSPRTREAVLATLEGSAILQVPSTPDMSVANLPCFCKLLTVFLSSLSRPRRSRSVLICPEIGLYLCQVISDCSSSLAAEMFSKAGSCHDCFGNQIACSRGAPNQEFGSTVGSVAVVAVALEGNMDEDQGCFGVCQADGFSGVSVMHRNTSELDSETPDLFHRPSFQDLSESSSRGSSRSSKLVGCAAEEKPKVLAPGIGGIIIV